MLEHEECRRFLTPAIFTILTKRLIEAKVPEGDRVYCPYANCSALMDKSGLGIPEQVINHFVSSPSNLVVHVGHCNCVSFPLHASSVHFLTYVLSSVICQFDDIFCVMSCPSWGISSSSSFLCEGRR